MGNEVSRPNNGTRNENEKEENDINMEERDKVISNMDNQVSLYKSAVW